MTQQRTICVTPHRCKTPKYRATARPHPTPAAGRPTAKQYAPQRVAHRCKMRPRHKKACRVLSCTARADSPEDIPRNRQQVRDVRRRPDAVCAVPALILGKNSPRQSPCYLPRLLTRRIRYAAHGPPLSLRCPHYPTRRQAVVWTPRADIKLRRRASERHVEVAAGGLR